MLHLLLDACAHEVLQSEAASIMRCIHTVICHRYFSSPSPPEQIRSSNPNSLTLWYGSSHTFLAAFHLPPATLTFRWSVCSEMSMRTSTIAFHARFRVQCPEITAVSVRLSHHTIQGISVRSSWQVFSVQGRRFFDSSKKSKICSRVVLLRRI